VTFQLPADWLILAAGALLAAGVLGAGFADRLRIPGLLLFLAIGMAIADDGLALVSLDDPTVAQIGGTIALLLILYEGGLTTKPRDVRRAAVPGVLLATVTVVLTAAIVAGGAILILDLDVITALLVGAVVSSTDAAAVFSVLRRAPLPRRLTALLEVESGVNDPTAIMLTVGVLEAWRADPSVLDWATFGVIQLGGGLVMGLAVGWLGAWLLNRAHLGIAGLYPVLALAVAGLSYGTAAAVGASGFLAVYVTGLVVGARVPRHRRTIRSFHNGLANTAEIGLFLMLGILVFPSRLPDVIVPGLVIAGVLVLLARPLAVLACLVWFRYRREDLTLMSWAGLRGAVPVVLATFPFTAGYPEGRFIFDMVFFVVLVSAALQGGTIGVVAGWLGLRDEGRVWAPVAEALPLDDAYNELVEVNLTEDLAVVGRQLRDVPLPPGALLTTIVRGDRTLVPTARTRLQSGDLLIVATPRQPDATGRLVRWARGEGGDSHGPAGAS
jgi:potassium/hydrogen antiporter